MSAKKLSPEKLTEKLAEAHSWEQRGEKIHKRFNFENFSESLDFVNKIGAIAEKQDHHPDITFGWGYAKIEITTHSENGLTEKDFELAKAIDEIRE